MNCIVILARKLDPGGAERQLVALAKGLHARGVEVQVVVFYAGGAFDGELAAAGVPLHCVGKRGRWDAVGFLVRLGAMLRRLRPAVVYAFLDVPNLMSALLRPLIGRPRLVWSIRAAGMEMGHYDGLFRWVAWLEARLSRTAEVIVANSHAGAAWAAKRGFPSERVRVVENGIDTERFRPDAQGRERVRREWGVRDDERLVGLAARLDVMKDHRNFLHACARLAASRANVRFVCVGGGPAAYRDELHAYAAQLGIASRLIWAGVRADMPCVYNALDVASSSSSFGEGFSNAIGEAMACGVPCVVTDVGDSARIVGDLGEVAPPRDADALSAALERLLNRLEREPDLGARARARIEAQFSLSRMIERTQAILAGSVA